MAMEKIQGSKQAFRQAQEELERLRDEMYLIEGRYIAENGIVNPDGTVPDCVLDIEDDDAFIEADAVCSEAAEESGLAKKLALAEQAMVAAEDALVAAGLGMLPEKYREQGETLEKAARENSLLRGRLLGLILRLDTGQEPTAGESSQSEGHGMEGMEMV